MEMFGSSHMESPQVRKRLFIGLIASSLVLVILLVMTGWYVLFHPTSILQQLILTGLVVVVLIGVILISFGIGGIVLTIWLAKTIKPLQGPMRIAMSLLFPFAIGLGHLFKIDGDKIKSSFIEVNNQLVRTMEQEFLPEQILVLAPHCIQKNTCPHKVTSDINNCRRCGACPVNDLLEIRERYGVRLGVATGGTLARKYVREYRPKAIVAIACERDLSSGIQDASPIPVLGVLNQRPFGPCFNTQISVPRVEEAIRFFLHHQKV